MPYQENAIAANNRDDAVTLVAHGARAEPPIIKSREIPPESRTANDTTRPDDKDIEPVLDTAAAATIHRHLDNQASAATTIASTPVCRVGWITGAKRGL